VNCWKRFLANPAKSGNSKLFASETSARTSIAASNSRLSVATVEHPRKCCLWPRTDLTKVHEVVRRLHFGTSCHVSGIDCHQKLPLCNNIFVLRATCDCVRRNRKKYLVSSQGRSGKSCGFFHASVQVTGNMHEKRKSLRVAP